jgi:hypothetical protein
MGIDLEEEVPHDIIKELKLKAMMANSIHTIIIFNLSIYFIWLAGQVLAIVLKNLLKQAKIIF